MMGSSSSLANTHPNMLYTNLPLNIATIPSQRCLPCNFVKVRRNLGFKLGTQSHRKGSNNNNGFVVGCASWSLVSEVERELEAEMNTPEEATDEEQEKTKRIGMGRFRHKCGEGKGVVEMLECLEKEAIMGEDVGKEPKDYNRRAQIFDRSSRVFQALKELNQ